MMITKVCLSRGAVLLVLLATPIVANADPSPAASAQPTPAANSSVYVEAGVEMGGDAVGLYTALRLDAGLRLDNGPLWVHAVVAAGGVGEVAAAGASSDREWSDEYLSVRGGIEARTCSAQGTVCASGGADLGFLHEYERTNYMATVDENRAVLVPHLGLDVGGKHVRFRPSIEASFGTVGLDGAGLTLAVAYQQ